MTVPVPRFHVLLATAADTAPWEDDVAAEHVRDVFSLLADHPNIDRLTHLLVRRLPDDHT